MTGEGISFFRLIDGVWVYIDELKSISNQNLLNRRLQYVYLNNKKLSFIYNNRIREYSLDTGELIRNQSKRDAKNGYYEGKEIRKLFFNTEENLCTIFLYFYINLMHHQI